MKDDDAVILSVKRNSKKMQRKGNKPHTDQGVNTPYAVLPRSTSLGELLYMLSLLGGMAFLWYSLNGTGMQIADLLVVLLVIILFTLVGIAESTEKEVLVTLTLKTVNILVCIAIFTFSKEFRGQFSKELVNIILKDVMNTIETHGYWAGVYKAIKSIFWMIVDGIKEQQHDPDSEEQPSADRS